MSILDGNFVVLEDIESPPLVRGTILHRVFRYKTDILAYVYVTKLQHFKEVILSSNDFDTKVAKLSHSNGTDSSHTHSNTIKVKKLNKNAVLPTKVYSTDAAFDLTAVSKEYDTKSKVYVYGFGIAIEIPENHVGLIFPRSSCFKSQMTLTNCVGVVDPGYSGEVKAMFKASSKDSKHHYRIGDRVCQLIILPVPKFKLEFTEDLSISFRGSLGFGSSGR